VTQPNDPIDLTAVYEDAGSGRLTASIPVVPGTISMGRNQAEAQANVVDARSAPCFRSSPRNFPTTQRQSASASLWPSHDIRPAIWVSTAGSTRGQTRSSHGSIHT
jgi:hypothetical protein